MESVIVSTVYLHIKDEARKLQSQKGCRKKIIMSLKIVYHGELQAINLDIVCQQYLLGQ